MPTFDALVERRADRPVLYSPQTVADSYLRIFGCDLTYIDAMEDYCRRKGSPISGLRELVLTLLEDETIRERFCGIPPASAPERHLLSAISGTEFEQLLHRAYQAQGYKVELTKASGDQGADLVIQQFGIRTVVQAKRWAEPVGNSAVQEAVAAKALYGCQFAMVVTSSRFTQSASELAAVNGVRLVEGNELRAMLLAQLKIRYE